MKIMLENNEYELIKDYRGAFNLEELTKRYDEYFFKYDYILCDYAYGKLRLKGFFNHDHKEVTESTDYQNINTYLDNHCAYDCKYFIVAKK